MHGLGDIKQAAPISQYNMYSMILTIFTTIVIIPKECQEKVSLTNNETKDI